MNAVLAKVYPFNQIARLELFTQTTRVAVQMEF